MHVTCVVFTHSHLGADLCCSDMITVNEQQNKEVDDDDAKRSNNNNNKIY